MIPKLLILVAVFLAGSGCRAPIDAPEVRFELVDLDEDFADQLAQRIGETKDCAPTKFVEQKDEIRVTCLSDVPLGQASVTFTVYCNESRGWIVTGGPGFSFDSLGGGPLQECDISTPMS